MARTVISRKFPIGVATIWSPGERAGAAAACPLRTYCPFFVVSGEVGRAGSWLCITSIHRAWTVRQDAGNHDLSQLVEHCSTTRRMVVAKCGGSVLNSGISFFGV